jgi:hypothetical protein
MAMRSPSSVILNLQKENRMVPGVRKRLKRAVMTIRRKIALRPFTMYRKGTVETLMTTPSAMLART